MAHAPALRSQGIAPWNRPVRSLKGRADADEADPCGRAAPDRVVMQTHSSPCSAATSARWRLAHAAMGHSRSQPWSASGGQAPCQLTCEVGAQQHHGTGLSRPGGHTAGAASHLVARRRTRRVRLPPRRPWGPPGTMILMLLHLAQHLPREIWWWAKAILTQARGSARSSVDPAPVDGVALAGTGLRRSPGSACSSGTLAAPRC